MSSMAGGREWEMATGPVQRAFDAHQESNIGADIALGA